VRRAIATFLADKGITLAHDADTEHDVDVEDAMKVALYARVSTDELHLSFFLDSTNGKSDRPLGRRLSVQQLAKIQYKPDS
jgi:hypothetical protein